MSNKKRKKSLVGWTLVPTFFGFNWKDNIFWGANILSMPLIFKRKKDVFDKREKHQRVRITIQEVD